MYKGAAFIGSREISIVPEHILSLYKRAVVAAIEAGYTIITGAAEGCDQFAAETALNCGGEVLLLLPWSLYEKPWWSLQMIQHPGRISIHKYDETQQTSWRDSVKEHHPNWQKLSQGAYKLHARNYGIVDTSKIVVAVSNLSKPGGGGTGQGIRIAKAQGKKVWDLSQEADFDRLTDTLNFWSQQQET